MSDQKPRILLVEDDLALATAYRVRMEAEGFDVKHCPNGEEAMQEALEYRPDLILLDVMMPKLDGVAVTRLLKADTGLPFMPIILVTAKALLDSEPHPSRERIREALSGNLCRCTGYGQIIDAVEAAAKR